MWVRLNELPIEYYESHILKHIGSSIGNVLRVDTHTAVEARGRYARLCVQIDINKLLVSTVLIGDLEQPVLYEGISRLCFSCGRVGHRKESCPYTIRSPSSLAKEDNSPSPLASPPLGPIHCKRVKSTWDMGQDVPSLILYLSSVLSLSLRCVKQRCGLPDLKSQIYWDKYFFFLRN